ncbi:MAG: hypothetical protein IT198_04315 [Acidimicrobiia bacterium]|nr:hypothetical protein [Acidimicrobiia bacterium]
MDSRGRERHETGQAAVEWVLVVVVAAAVGLTLSVIAPGMMRDLYGAVTSVLCRALGLDCAEPDGPCVVSSDSYRAGGHVVYKALKLEGGGTYTLERLSDGTFRVSWSETGRIGAVAGSGSRAEADVGDTTVGHSGSASAGVHLGFEEGVVGSFATEAEAREFVTAHAASRAAGRFGRALTVPLGLPNLPGLPDPARELIDRRWPELDRYISVDAGASAAASLRRLMGGAAGLLGTDLGVRLAGDGSSSLFTTLVIDVAADVAQIPDRPALLAARGSVELLARLDVTAGGEASYLTLEVTLAGDTSGRLLDLLVGDPGHGGGIEGSGTLTIGLDLSDPHVRADLDAVGTALRRGPDGRLEAARLLVDLIRRRGRITWMTYDTQGSEWGGTLAAGSGLPAGISAGITSDHRALTRALYLDPAAGWSEWTRCTGGRP